MQFKLSKVAPWERIEESGHYREASLWRGMGEDKNFLGNWDALYWQLLLL